VVDTTTSNGVWAARNGVLIAQTGDAVETAVGPTENWASAFLAFTGNAQGDWVLVGRTDNADPAIDDVVVYNELAEQGMTLDQYLQAERDTTLIKQLISEKVWPRVIVSWKDVEREYQRRYAEFNPPATVTILRIRVPASDVEKVEEVKSRLARGESFAEVSLWIGPGAAGPMGEPFVLGPGGIGEIAVNDAYKQKLAGLTVGQTTEPVEVGGNINWLHVQSVDQPPQLSLYDVQMVLINELRQRRFREEYRQYIDSLLKRGIYDNMQEMSQRVLQVAMMRYGR
jgi:hypothetical protein